MCVLCECTLEQVVLRVLQFYCSLHRRHCSHCSPTATATPSLLIDTGERYSPHWRQSDGWAVAKVSADTVQDTFATWRPNSRDCVWVHTSAFTCPLQSRCDTPPVLFSRWSTTYALYLLSSLSLQELSSCSSTFLTSVPDDHSTREHVRIVHNQIDLPADFTVDLYPIGLTFICVSAFWHTHMSCHCYFCIAIAKSSPPSADTDPFISPTDIFPANFICYCWTTLTLLTSFLPLTLVLRVQTLPVLAPPPSSNK